MILISNPDKSQWQEILKRPVMNTENLFDTVRSVIDRVKEEGDRAVLDYEEKFDKVVLASLAVSEEEQQEAENLVSEDLKAAIRLAKQNIETFHAAQRSVCTGRYSSAFFYGTDAGRSRQDCRMQGDCSLHPSGT